MEVARSPQSPGGQPPTIEVRGTRFHAVDERQVVQQVLRGLASSIGGWIVTPNADILRICAGDPVAAIFLKQATCVVADGMPVIWASRIAGTPLPERVTGASLIFSISAALAQQSGSIYLIGGGPGVADQAALNLATRFSGLRVVGTDSPPYGFEHDPAAVSEIAAGVRATDPDVVFVGLGFPKQERLIGRMRETCPRQWFVGCGAAVPIAAGVVPRAPRWAQRVGIEWLHRLSTEPRRLARRYLVDDVPFVMALLAAAAWQRLTARRRQAPGAPEAHS